MRVKEGCLGYKVIEFQETPNPNAVKCVLDRAMGGGGKLRSYQSGAAAEGDALGLALMAIPGVVGVLIHSEWVTVSRAPGEEWKGIKAAVKRVLADVPDAGYEEGIRA